MNQITQQIWIGNSSDARNDPALRQAGIDAIPKRAITVFANGCFDLLHAGHIDFLKRARALGDTLIVGVNSDRSVRELKGAWRPIYPEAHRLEIVQAVRWVDHAELFDSEEELAAMIEARKVDVLVKGEDYRGKSITGAEHAGRIEFLPLLPALSTTATIYRTTRAAFEAEEV